MPKPSHRDKILAVGLEVIHQHGFTGASVRDITRAAGVPQGSFTNHFISKEAFGVEVLDLYFQATRERIAATLDNADLPPLRRLAAYFEVVAGFVCQEDGYNGCLIGNLSAEAPEHSEALRHRLSEVYAATEEAVARCLKAAVASGDARADLDCEETASYIVASFQGAILRSKVSCDRKPLDRFSRMVFSMLVGVQRPGELEKAQFNLLHAATPSSAPSQP